MMNNEIALLNYLKSVGFEDPKLVTGIGPHLQAQQPRFSIQIVRSYGEEQMRYELRFEYDRQFQSYRLADFRATHRNPVVIDHRKINGIDTAMLEQRMQREDWEDYFGEKLKYQQNQDKQFAGDTIDMLDKLSENHDFNGRQIQEELRFKYWPLDAYSDAGQKDLKRAYEQSREFSASPYGICSPDLAYHIVSGHLAQLHEQVMSTGLEQYPGIDLYNLIEFHLSTNAQSFSIECSQYEQEGIIEYHIPVLRTSAGYEASSTEVTFRTYPDYQHGIYNGIDATALEKRMAAINWEKDEVYIMEGQDVILLPHIAGIKDQIDQLSEDEKGRDIAEYLLIRYWGTHPVLDSFMETEIWEASKKWPTIKQDFPLDFDARSIYNLMCGRPIIGQPIGGHTLQPGDWLRLDTTILSEQGIHPFQVIPGLTREEVEQQVRMLPLSDRNILPEVSSLLKGDMVLLELREDKEVKIEVIPEEKSLKLYTIDDEPIGFNFRVDPDWKRTEMPSKGIQQIQRSNKKNKRHNKGRKM